MMAEMQSDTPNSSIPNSPKVQSLVRTVRGTRLPLLLVIVSLAFAILVPRLTQHRIARLRNEINDLADPARLLTMEIQLALAHGGSARRGYLLTGDRQLADQFHAVRKSTRLNSSPIPL